MLRVSDLFITVVLIQVVLCLWPIFRPDSYYSSLGIRIEKRDHFLCNSCK